MANRTLGGFRWRGSANAPSVAEPPIEIHPVADDFAVQLSLGDPVKLISTGYIEDADPGDAVYGIFAGAEQYFDGDVIRKGGKIPADVSYDTNFARQTLARIIPARGQLFECDADDGTTATTWANWLALVGENVEWQTGTAVGDWSGATLDISGHATTDTLSVRIRGIPNRDMQDLASSRVKVLCEFNLVQSTLAGAILGT